MSDPRPIDCRHRLQDEGKPYPRSSCTACGADLRTLGKSCQRYPMTSSPHTGELVAALARFDLDATDLDMIQRGDMLGPRTGAKVFTALSTLERELEEARARFEKHGDYSIQLQRIIEAICHGRELRQDSADLHHHKMAVQYMSASHAEVERLKAALSHHERLLLVNSVRNAAKVAAPLWLEAADHAAESVRAQVEERKP